MHHHCGVVVSLSPAWKFSEPLQFRFLWRLHYGVLVRSSALVMRSAPPLAPLPSQEVRAWGKFQPSDHLVGSLGN